MSVSSERLRFAAAQCKMTLGPLLESERQARVYALVSLRPGENYHYYAKHAWGSYSGKVYDELEALAKKRLIWYVVVGGWEGSKLVGTREFKQKRQYYPTHEFLARTVQPKLGAYRWLLDEYNEALRDAIERVPGRTSASRPCVIMTWNKEDMDIATARINVARAKLATIAICGDLDGWREFVEPYKYLVNDGRPVGVLHVESDDATKSNAASLRAETAADIRSTSDEGKVGSLVMGYSKKIEQEVVERVSSYPWTRLTIKPTFQPPGTPMRAYCRLNVVDDTVILPFYSPSSHRLDEYKAVVLRHPDVANQLYQVFAKVFPPLEGFSVA